MDARRLASRGAWRSPSGMSRGPGGWAGHRPSYTTLFRPAPSGSAPPASRSAWSAAATVVAEISQATPGRRRPSASPGCRPTRPSAAPRRSPPSQTPPRPARTAVASPQASGRASSWRMTRHRYQMAIQCGAPPGHRRSAAPTASRPRVTAASARRCMKGSTGPAAGPRQVEGQPGHGRDDQRVAQELLQQAALPVARQHAHRRHVGEGTMAPHRAPIIATPGSRGKLARHRDADVGVETVGALGPRGKAHRVQAEQRPPGQRQQQPGRPCTAGPPPAAAPSRRGRGWPAPGR